MSKKMLIDARHPEETRVAILSHGKVEDFDFETASRKALRGNIYLARVTRVEPSLQAAFVEYGGNRHGFLAFSEIHPDYYQIPVADRDVLREAEDLETELAQKLAELDSDEDVAAVVDPDDPEVTDESNDASASADDAEEQPKPRGRRRGRGRRRRGRSSEQSASETEDSGEAQETAPTEQGEAALSEAADAETETSVESSDDLPEATDTAPSPDEQEAPADELSADADVEDNASSDAHDESVDEDPKTPPSVALEDPSPSVVAELDDPELTTTDAEDTPSETPTAVEDENPSSDVDAQEQVEDGEVSEAQSDDGGDEVEAEEAPREKTPEEIEAERIAAERAAEIDELRNKYQDAKRAREKLLRNYRIQEVIKRRQIMLIQVVKEERGNKGAALTSYLSLAGRYGVLMPNNARGGGVSRKITNSSDRRRLRKAIAELDVPKGQGLIIRTAGAKRTKAEIKRDYDYLSRLWTTIRDQTLNSIAPCLIYEEASLIKRAIRDLYDKDTAEVVVEGEDGYREAKDFMKMLMPSHAKSVQPYKDNSPMFLRYDVERQLDEMYQPVVNLKSGGYLVIQQTEALISIDVNSGKATKERSVEATALKTNSEAAQEVARQCRLRDLAGLLVIDFIDMEENRNNKAVERKLKDALKTDRARIQVGSISTFGLMEMSRQRRRSGIVDGTTRACPTCDGAGAVRSVEMASLRILRAIEEAATKDRAAEVTVTASQDVALYILNQKRAWLNTIESGYGIAIEILSDHAKAGDQYDIAKRGRAPARPESSEQTPVAPTSIDPDAPEAEATTTSETDSVETDDSGEAKPKRRRRRRRRGRDADAAENAETADNDEQPADETATANEGESAEKPDTGADETDGEPKKRRRRGRRGDRKAQTETSSSSDSEADSVENSSNGESTEDAEAPSVVAEQADPTPSVQDAHPEPEAPMPDLAPQAAEAIKSSKPKRVGWWSKALGRDG